MAVGRQGAGTGHLGALGTLQASSFAPFPAPSGFHWEFVTNLSDGSRVTDLASGTPVIMLVGN